MRFSFIAAASAALLSASAAQSAVIVNVQEVGANVVIDYSGMIDLTGLDHPGNIPGAPFSARVTPNAGEVISLNGGYALYTFGSTTVAHGPGSVTSTIDRSGDDFGFLNGVLTVAIGYVSGTALSGSLTFVGASLFTLGYAPGAYVTALPNDTITTNVIASAVPLPAAAPLLLGALALTGFAARRRKG